MALLQRNPLFRLKIKMVAKGLKYICLLAFIVMVGVLLARMCIVAFRVCIPEMLRFMFDMIEIVKTVYINGHGKCNILTIAITLS